MYLVEFLSLQPMFPPKPLKFDCSDRRFGCVKIFLKHTKILIKVKEQMVREATRDAFTCQCATQVSVRHFNSRQFSRTVQYSTVQW